MGERLNRFNRASFKAWKRRAAGFAGLVVVALLLLGFVLSFLKTLFFGLALVGMGYMVWVLSRKTRRVANAHPAFRAQWLRPCKKRTFDYRVL